MDTSRCFYESDNGLQRLQWIKIGLTYTYFWIICSYLFLTSVLVILRRSKIMKVTVCFDSIRVVVPCGDGNILVRDLVQQSVARYKKAAAKPHDCGIVVHNLKTFDGGILDLDDTISDVVDDRDQIIAVFETNCYICHHNKGDGNSSTGTSSPDVFQFGRSCDSCNSHCKMDSKEFVKNKENCNIDQLSQQQQQQQLRPDLHLVQMCSDVRMNKHQGNSCANRFRGSGQEQDDDTSEDNESTFKAFTRSSSRKSINNTAAMMHWLEAQEKTQNNLQIFNREEPIGSSEESCLTEQAITGRNSKMEQDSIVVLENTGEPLGIHVVPSFNEQHRNIGLVIYNIEQNGRAHQDGRLHLNDCITEINDSSLLDLDFSVAQEIFRKAMQTPQIRLRIIPSSEDNFISAESRDMKETDRNVELATADGDNPRNGETADSTSESTIPPTQPAKSKFLPIVNTRIIGQKLNIDLVKGNQGGLGFSITTRDNQSGGDCPIYIKNILPQGAAIQDGRLHPGDRLLEVNSITMSGKTQEEAVSIFRSIKVGEKVSLVISRLLSNEQETVPCSSSIQTVQSDSSTINPANHVEQSSKVDQSERSDPIKSEHPITNKRFKESSRKPRAYDNGIFSSYNTEFLTFHINIEDIQQSTGLGISVKGKSDKTESGNLDRGLFIKSVLPGRAAAKDGRLMPEDCLLEINGDSLVGYSNAEAMNVLRQAMQKTGPNPGFVSLVISRTQHSVDRTLLKLQNDDVDCRSDDGFTKPFDTDLNSALASGPSNLIDCGNMFERTASQDRAILSKYQLTRNVSYQQATNESTFVEYVDSTDGVSSSKATTMFTSPTIGGNRKETVLIEDDDYNKTRTNHYSLESKSKRSKPKDEDSDDSSSNSTCISTIAPAKGFNRDGFGRQSMSEKRKAYADPKTCAIYQQVKNLKGINDKMRRATSEESMLGQNSAVEPQPIIRPAAENGVRLNCDENLRRSSSLDSLQVPLDYVFPDGQGRSRINRAWNASFRAAVDRSYDKHIYDRCVTPDDSTSISSSCGSSYDDPEKRRNRKERNLLRELGDMLRFGRAKKEGSIFYSAANDFAEPPGPGENHQINDRFNNKPTSEEENPRVNYLQRSNGGSSTWSGRPKTSQLAETTNLEQRRSERQKPTSYQNSSGVKPEARSSIFYSTNSSISNAVKANCWNCQTDPPYPRTVQPTPRRLESPAYCCDGMPCGEFNAKQTSGNSNLKLERRNLPPNSSVNLDSRSACYNNSKDTRAAMEMFHKSNEISSAEDRSRGYPNGVKLKPRRHLENPMSRIYGGPIMDLLFHRQHKYDNVDILIRQIAAHYT